MKGFPLSYNFCYSIFKSIYVRQHCFFFFLFAELNFLLLTTGSEVYVPLIFILFLVEAFKTMWLIFSPIFGKAVSGPTQKSSFYFLFLCYFIFVVLCRRSESWRRRRPRHGMLRVGAVGTQSSSTRILDYIYWPNFQCINYLADEVLDIPNWPACLLSFYFWWVRTMTFRILS